MSHTPLVPSLVCRAAQKRSAEITNDGENGNKESISIGYIVKYDEPLDDIRDALYVSGIPDINEPYSSDAPWLLCSGKNNHPVQAWLCQTLRGRQSPQSNYLIFIDLKNLFFTPLCDLPKKSLP